MLKGEKLLKLLLSAASSGLDPSRIILALRRDAVNTRRKLARELEITEQELFRLLSLIEPEIYKILQRTDLYPAIERASNRYRNKARELFFNEEIWRYQPIPARLVMWRWLKRK